MFQLAHPVFFTCETPLHAGSGDSLGVVDLPIQRERHTSFPKIEASSLKGALRESFAERTGRTNTTLLKAFGPEDGDLNAGALGFTDARLLLFPVKSMKGVFAWITCSKALKQLSVDLKLSVNLEISGAITDPADGSAMPLSDQITLVFGGHLVLEEYTFSKGAKADLKIGEKPLSDWLAENLFAAGYWQDKAKKDIVVLSDNDFKDFVNLSTEVITRIKINPESGTVQKGALFTEEYLPAESVLYSLVLASPEFLNTNELNARDEHGERRHRRPEKADAIMKFFTDNLNPVVQLGGNATLGKGLLRTKIISLAKTSGNNG